MPYFDYQEKSCYFEERGQGMPLLFLHGNTASSRMYAQLCSGFTNEYKTVLLDFLGHGGSDRVEQLAVDLWYDEAQQVIAFLEQIGYQKVHLIGCSGGAQVAINVALERPDLVGKVIADSFEGAVPLSAIIQGLAADREASKQEEGGRAFYQAMHSSGWESVVDNDTTAMLAHAQTIGHFFHQPLSSLQAPILFTGSLEDPFLALVGPDFYQQTYTDLLQQIGHGQIHLFAKGDHPAALSNPEAFTQLALEFLKADNQ